MESMLGDEQLTDVWDRGATAAYDTDVAAPDWFLGLHGSLL